MALESTSRLSVTEKTLFKPEMFSLLPPGSRRMQPGEYLVIIGPNFDNFLRKKLGENWRGITPKAHNYHFNSLCLERILEPFYEIVKWRSEEGPYGLETLLEYVSRDQAESLFADLEGSELTVAARKPLPSGLNPTEFKTYNISR